MRSQSTRKEIYGFRSDTATVHGKKLHYWLGGDPDGSPVLLWHGFLGTGYSWHKVMPLAAKAGYAVIVPDMRGYGDSDKPPGVDGYDWSRARRGVPRAHEQIGFGSGRPLTIVVHDMGAPPALLWASDHPDEVGGLIYAGAPAMLQSVLEKIITYTPQAMAKGSMCGGYFRSHRAYQKH